MDLIKAMQERHSVRRYTDEPLKKLHVDLLKGEIEKINSQCGVTFLLVTNEPTAFSGKMAHYGHFSGCTDYIIAVGRKNRDEQVGYYGERLVLFAQSIGVNSCWVALTYDKSKIKLRLTSDEKVYIVIALGYGVHQGKPHTNKPFEKLCSCNGEMPEWFENAMNCVLLAPTAINQQKFHFELKDDNVVKAKAFLGPCSKMDLGIAKCHFVLGAGNTRFRWEE